MKTTPRLLIRSVPLVATFVLCSGGFASAQDVPQVPPLTDDENRAISVITEGRVLSTVSFLASDEMAGRDTPSKELTIAESYVAARFRGAGLEGLGPDGSFFQETSFPMVQPPDDASLQIAGVEESKNVAALTGPKNDLELTGVVLSEPKALAATDPKIVIIDEDALGTHPGQIAQRGFLAFARIGAALLEVQVRDDEQPLARPPEPALRQRRQQLARKMQAHFFARVCQSRHGGDSVPQCGGGQMGNAAA